MLDHEIRDWLNDAPVTDEQIEQLRAAADLAEAFADDADGSEQAFSAMAQIILGDTSLDGLAAVRQAAVAREAAARTALYAGIRWSLHERETAVSIQERTGVSRVTIGRLADQ